MKTLRPTLRLGRDVWDRAAMPVEEFHDRVARLRDGMAGGSLDALLLFGAGLDDCGHPTWISHYVVKLPFGALVVLPREGEPALLFQGATRGRSAAASTTWIEDVRPCWDLGTECLRVLGERGLLRATIGLAGLPRLMPFGGWATLAAGLAGARLVDAEPLVDRLRAIKSHREILQVERARRIVHEALSTVTAVHDANLTEARIAAEVTFRARRQGAEDVRFAIGRSIDGAWVFGPAEETAFAVGERICVSLAASWDRYWAEAAITYEIGLEGLARVETGNANAHFGALAGRVRTGATMADVRMALGRAVRALDVRGIGITPEEPLDFSTAPGAELERGMCLVIRAALQDASASAYCADTFIVSDSR